jgi:cytochrome c oxidase subunit 2
MTRWSRIAAAALLVVFAGATKSSARGDAPPRVVAIAAKRFEFVPATVTLRRGEPVVLRVTSEDVTHGFFSRLLRVDGDLPAGQPQEFAVTPPEAGTFTIICHHFCGAQHAAMKLTVVVEEPAAK